MEKLQLIEGGSDVYEFWQSKAGVVHCSCSGFRRHAHCRHTNALYEFLNRSKTAYYTALSGFHKEIRRSDYHRAKHWGEWVAKFKGDWYVKNYMKKILFEEARSLGVFCKWHDFSRLNWKDMLKCFCLIPKKWEIDEIRDFYCLRDQVFHFERRSSQSSIARNLVYDSIFKDTDIFYERLRDTLTSMNGKDIIKVVDYYGIENGNVVDFALEFVYFAERGKDYVSFVDSLPKNPITESLKEKRQLFLFDVKGYYFDGHTRFGSERIKKAINKIGYNKALPLQLDLRWAGHEMFTIWRFFAHSQFGDKYKSAKWEDVKMPNKLKFLEEMMRND